MMLKYNALAARDARGIFFRGFAGEVTFLNFVPTGVKCLFPVENFILVHPKQISVVSKYEKKRKKKKSFAHFHTFPYLFSIFHLPLYNFSLFCSPFSLLSLPLFSQ